MRSVSAFAIAIALAGCGGAQQDIPCHGYGCEYDLIDADGTRFRQGADLLTAAEFERLVVAPYREVERCVQVLTGGPLVIVTDAPRAEAPPAYGKTYLEGEPTILIDPSWVEFGPAAVSGLKHEYVHYALRALGFPMERNRDHDSPLFMQCAGI